MASGSPFLYYKEAFGKKYIKEYQSGALSDGLLTRTEERRYNVQIEAYLPILGGVIE